MSSNVIPIVELLLGTTLKLRTLLRHQNDNRRFRDASHASLNHDSFISDSGY
jgi:hypothetical protein